MSTPATPAPIGGMSVAWLSLVAAMLEHEGRAFRAAEAGPWIEVQNISTGLFEPLTLENRSRGDVAFATIADRDAAFAEITRRMQPSAFTDAERAQAGRVLDTLAAVAPRS